MRDPNRRRVSVVRHEEDMPNIEPGLLIPNRAGLKWSLAVNIPGAARIKKPHIIMLVFSARYMLPVAIFLFAFISTSLSSQFVLSKVNVANLLASPVFVVENPQTTEVTPLTYGVQLALAQPDFYSETHAAFVDAKMTFIEADLSDMRLRYFEDGILVDQATIHSKGQEGSWWDTPAGLYRVENKEANPFSNFGQVYHPYSLSFQGNFSIHGWPEFADNTLVPEDFSGGSIRLATEDARRLFEQVAVSTSILIHERADEPDTFVYEPKIPELETPHYLIADIESNTVLASSNMEAEPVSIASLTKLMTALVAAEYLNLDTDVWVSQPTFVQSLVPRLGERSRVSMYSLLQLLLVESSNEAAEVIAAQLGREQFIEHMNEKALEIGMENTVFTDPSGLDNGNKSTVTDLLRLTKYIHANRSFIFEMTANQNLPTSYVSGEFGELQNFNKVEGLENFIGGKIGETEAAGQTSITLHRLWVKNSPRTLAIILLGSKQRNRDVDQLFTYALERF